MVELFLNKKKRLTSKVNLFAFVWSISDRIAYLYISCLYESVPYIFPTYREQTYIIPYKKMHLQLYEEAH